jgi:hypothetical protein
MDFGPLSPPFLFMDFVTRQRSAFPPSFQAFFRNSGKPEAPQDGIRPSLRFGSLFCHNCSR